MGFPPDPDKPGPLFCHIQGNHDNGKVFYFEAEGQGEYTDEKMAWALSEVIVRVKEGEVNG